MLLYLLALLGAARGALYWGLPDTSAPVGRVFNLTLSPPQQEGASSHNIFHLEVSEAGESRLPSWLHFDQETWTFQGVPLSQDAGQHYVSVRAFNKEEELVYKDVFSIEVTEGRHKSICPIDVPETLATVALDINLEDLDLDGRVELLQKLASFMQLELGNFKMESAAGGQSTLEDNALKAGPGDVRQRQTTGALVSWPVGCQGQINVALDGLESSAQDGRLAELLGFPVIGWYISSLRLSPLGRDKRQMSLQGTPIPGIFPTRVEDSEESIVPESRIVPTMVSPVVTHHIRHHHGEGVMERGHHHHIEPTLPVMVPFKSSQILVLGTPILVPERPLVTTTFGPLEASRVLPDEFTPVDVLTSSMVDLRPSAPLRTIPTAVLTSEIKPTKTHIVTISTKKPYIHNFKPIISNRVKKLSMYAGKTWSFKIPKDTFHDIEDGDTRKLRLMFLTANHTAIPPSLWIQFEPTKQVLYALPLEENVGKYEFILEAMDSEGNTTFDKLQIHVWQLPTVRAVHHEFSLSLTLPKYQYPIAIDWQREVIRRVAAFFGDKNESHITVQSVITTDPNVIITWTNDSLPSHPCPRSAISSLYKMLKGESSDKTKSFKKFIGPEIKVKDVSLKFHGVCKVPASTTPSSGSNFSPMLRNPIEHINTTVGEILRFKVPDDTFYDFEEGNTRYLTLTFLTIDGVLPPKSSWVHFNPKSQELYGLPFDGDAGRHEFQMVAMDNDGLSINDAFVIQVHARPPKKWSVEFSIHLHHNYEEFSRDIGKKVLVAWKLAKLYGDPDPRFITVSSISKGSVVYAWTNNTLPYDPCPKRKISQLVKNLFNENGTISYRLIEAMHPEFKIIKADAMPLGICLGEVTPRTVTMTPPPRHVDIQPTASSEEDIYLSTVTPAIVIAVMLLVATVVACALYRQRRKGKLTMQDASTFINKGIPIIFTDELDDRPDPAKPPVIMRDEKPPLSAPEYFRTSSRASSGPPDPSPPYEPPPPFTTSNKNPHRPKAAPIFRQPPPYDVPP